MNPTSITLTALALAGALSSAYFWHQTGKQKEDQLRAITELKVENTTLRRDGENLRGKLANAETRGEALTQTLEKERQQQQLMGAQLADSRRENEALRLDSAKVLAQADMAASENRQLREEIESLGRQLSHSVRPEQLAALKTELADSRRLAKVLEDRIKQLSKADEQPVTVPSPSGGNVAKVSTFTNRLVSTKVRQVRGDKVLLGYGARQGAAVNADVRLQDGLDYLGFGRVIYVDDNQCLVELNKGHDSIPADKDIYLLTPEASEQITIRE